MDLPKGSFERRTQGKGTPLEPVYLPGLGVAMEDGCALGDGAIAGFGRVSDSRAAMLGVAAAVADGIPSNVTRASF